MAFMDSFNKGITTLNMKTNNFVEVSKCKTYITTLEKEIEQLKLEIGTKLYEQHKNGESDTSSIEQHMLTIDSKYQEIEQQRARMRELEEEEKQVLGNNTAAAPSEDVIFCGQCGAKNAGNYKFCCKCGSPLK